ncbi:MAG: Holliday junction resolvase RuvX [Candidatus Moraniibacteriota bacterium]
MEKKYLGIDWGKAKVGLAIAHGETRLALSLKTLLNDEHLLETLQDLIREEGVSTAVIGLPSHMSHERADSPVEKLGQKLVDLGILVAYQDEMFTTKRAGQNLIEAGKKAVGKQDDAEAARIILQEWLDHEKALGQASF